MPLQWKHGDNPYRVNWFEILELGPYVPPSVIAAMRRKITTKIEHGTPHIIGRREIDESEVYEAEARLLDEQSRALESLLLYLVRSPDMKRLQEICTTILSQTTMVPAPDLHLANLRALAALVPEPSPVDIELPTWEELEIPSVDSPDDMRDDIQFDL